MAATQMVNRPPDSFFGVVDLEVVHPIIVYVCVDENAYITSAMVPSVEERGSYLSSGSGLGLPSIGNPRNGIRR